MGYQDITFVDDQLIDSETMQTIAGDLRYLYDNTPAVYYRAYDVRKNTGMKVACGVVQMVPHKAKQINRDISFGNYFSASCRPVVVVTGATGAWVSIEIAAQGGHTRVVNNTGFRIYLQSNEVGKVKSYFPSSSYIHWIAIGW